MPSAPSYYDSIGLLAICDAIDAVEGIPFKPSSKPQPLPTYAHMNSSGPLPPANIPAPSVIGKSAPTQHVFLSHIPVTGMAMPTGAIPYEEQQRVAINQLASTGQLPAQTPHHTIGGARPTIPVAHNLGAASTGPRGTPSIPPSPQARGPSPGFGATGPQGLHRVTGQSPGIRGPSIPPSKSASPGFAAGMPAPPQTVPAHMGQPGLPQGMPSQGPLPTTMAQNMPRMNTGGAMPQIPQPGPAAPQGMPPVPGMAPLDGPSMSLSRASTPNNAGSPMESPQPQGGDYRIEVCQICGRDFKGPKAATHKQQHIRRLHPTEYTPKRGGKKSRE